MDARILADSLLAAGAVAFFWWQFQRVIERLGRLELDHVKVSTEQTAIKRSLDELRTDVKAVRHTINGRKQ